MFFSKMLATGYGEWMANSFLFASFGACIQSYCGHIYYSHRICLVWHITNLCFVIYFGHSLFDIMIARFACEYSPNGRVTMIF